jgi:hypothetical protein
MSTSGGWAESTSLEAAKLADAGQVVVVVLGNEEQVVDQPHRRLEAGV